MYIGYNINIEYIILCCAVCDFTKGFIMKKTLAACLIILTYTLLFCSVPLCADGGGYRFQIFSNSVASENAVFRNEDTGKCYNIAVTFLDNFYSAVYGDAEFKPEIQVEDRDFRDIINDKLLYMKARFSDVPCKEYSLEFSVYNDTETVVRDSAEGDLIFFVLSVQCSYRTEATSYYSSSAFANECFAFRKTEDGNYLLSNWFTDVEPIDFILVCPGGNKLFFDDYVEAVEAGIDYSGYIDEIEEMTNKRLKQYSALRLRDVLEAEDVPATADDAKECISIAEEFLDEFYGAVYGNASFRPKLEAENNSFRRIINNKLFYMKAPRLQTPCVGYSMEYLVTDEPVVIDNFIYLKIIVKCEYTLTSSSEPFTFSRAEYFTFRRIRDGFYLLRSWYISDFFDSFDAQLLQLNNPLLTFDGYIEMVNSRIRYSVLAEKAAEMSGDRIWAFGGSKVKMAGTVFAAESDSSVGQEKTVVFPSKSFGIYNRR